MKTEEEIKEEIENVRKHIQAYYVKNNIQRFNSCQSYVNALEWVLRK